MTQRHVEDANAEALAVGDGPIDGLDHAARVSGALGVHDLEVDEVDVRGDAENAVALTGSTDDARDVRAVAEAVATVLFAGDEVRVGQDAVTRHSRAGGQPRVDQRDRDALAGQTQVASEEFGADGRHGHVHVASDDAVRRHGKNSRISGEIFDLTPCHLCGETANAVQSGGVSAHACTGPFDLVDRNVRSVGHDDPHLFFCGTRPDPALEVSSDL